MLVIDKKMVGILVIQWPDVWAQKADKVLPPHLGSLEFYVIGAQLSELYLEIIDNFSNDDIEKSWISHFKIKAGAEAETEVFQEQCECAKTSQKPISEITDESTFEIRIGKAIVVISICHPKGVPNPRISINKIKNISENRNYTYFSCGYKIPVHRIFDIHIDKEKRTATAEVEMINQELVNIFKGIGSSFQPCFSYCDAILIVGQLSQILLFNLDGITRENASNLWMRSIESTYTEPIGDRFKVELRADEFKQVNLRNTPFRASNLYLNCEDKMIAKLKFAYQL